VLTLIQTKDLANDALGTVPEDRATEPTGRDDSKPGDLQIIREHEKREKSPPGPNTLLLNAQEIWPAAKPLSAGQG